MKITDLSIELNTLQIKTVSEQEANAILGGSKLTDAVSSLKKEEIGKALSSAVKSATLRTRAGVPGDGGEPDPSCPYW